MKAPKRAPSENAVASCTLLDVRRIRLLLGRSPHSSTLTGDFLDRLARLGRIERCKGGDLVHAAWQPVDKLWVVLSGALRVTQFGDDGSARTIALLDEGSYYGAGSLVKEGEVVKSEAHAVGRTQLAVFGIPQLDREFSSDKLMENHRMELLYRRLLVTIDLARDAIAVPLPQRLARRLLSQALAAGAGACALVLYVAHARRTEHPMLISTSK